MPDLTTIAAVKVDLGITGSSEDASLASLISSESQNFMNETHRLDFSPVVTFTDYLVGNDRYEIFLNHYPIQTITSLTIGDVLIPVWSSLTPDTLGYVFDNTLPPENRVKIYLRGSGAIFPRAYTGGSYYNSYYYYRPIVVVYTAGYALADVPANVKRAISEIIAIKRGVSQVQAGTQSGTSVTLGDYSEGATSGSTSATLLTTSVPDSIQSVIEQYSRPQI